MKYKTFCLLLISSIILTRTNITAADFLYDSKRISTLNGLTCNTVNDIIQDKDGFIWMGTSNGLCRYDGYSFVNFHKLSSISDKNTDSHVALLFKNDKAGVIWVYTSRHSLSCYDIKKSKFIDYTGKGDEMREFHNRYQSSNGMWLYDDNFGARYISYVKDRFITKDFCIKNHNFPTNNIHTIREDNLHNTWFFTDNGVIAINKSGEIRSILKGHNIIANKVEKNRIYFMTSDNNVYIYDSNFKQIIHTYLSSAIGHINKVTSSIIWQGRWLIFTDSDTYSMNIENGVFSKPSDIQVIGGRERFPVNGYSFISDDKGYFWILPQKGKAKKFKLIPDIKYANTRDGMYSVTNDKRGLLYIATYGNGLFIYNPQSGNMSHHTPNEPHPLIYSNFLLCISIDRSGCIWVSNETAGVAKISIVGSATANYIYPEYTHQNDWANYVRHIYKKSESEIIVSTKENKLYKYNPLNGDIKYIKDVESCIYTYFIDRAGHTWMGTRGGGLYIDGKKYSKKDSVYHIPVNDFYDISEDRYGRIWLATWDGGLLMTKYEKGKPLTFKQYLNRSFNEGRIRDIEINRMGDMWLATNNGLYYVNTNARNISDKSFICYNTNNGVLSNNEIICLEYTKSGHLWIGALGSGALDCTFSRNHKHIKYTATTTLQGLVNNNVNSLIEDNNGDIWAGTEEGISRINTKNHNIKTYQFSNSLQGNVITEDCTLKLKDGRMLFGSYYGLAIITPEKELLRYSRQKYNVHITDLKINGESIYNELNSKNEDLIDALNSNKQINLKHNENSITINFSNFNYKEIKTSLYQYYLEGLNNKWQKATSVNYINYNNLDPGYYKFHIRTMNDNNQWSDETTIGIKIMQPWYGTWLAWIIYIIIIGYTIYYIYVNGREKIRMHQKMQIDNQLTEFRLNFFTHITHEFRTPLAIIQGAVDKLNHPDGHTSTRYALQTANRGTKRLLRLVNQLMEFRKVSTDNFKINIERADIISFIKDISQDFWPLSKQKDITLIFTPFAKEYQMLFDKHIIETIVYNLLSNAIKYTQSKGTVQLRVSKDAKSGNIIITCEDNGPGIKDYQLDKLFKPFMHGYVSQGGMGIGLYNAYNMAIAHKGLLTYKKVSPDRGSVFTFTFPDDENIYNPEDYNIEQSPENQYEEENNAEEIIHEMLPAAINDCNIAIIEDDPDMMEQIKTELSVYFKVSGYMNGQDGYEKVIQDKPALIICDVMLPDMDGYSICHKIKGNEETSNIPIIMLTALDDEDHQIKGYKAGADDYMVKPCNFKILIARSIQLIEWSRKNKDTKEVRQDEPVQQSILTNQSDKVFNDKVKNLISEHISDPNFTIDQLASMLYMGRTKFYGKMKAITGMSPNKYLSNERMRIAAELLIEGEYTVSEISYKVGIQDASYFNKCFKAKYGIVPSKYGKE